MSNELATINGLNIPAHIMARMGQESAVAKSMAGGLGGGDNLPRISVKGSRFRIVEDGEETVLPTTYLDVVVIGSNPRMSKTYYAKAWDPDDTGAPDCKSLGGVAPDDDSADKQSDLCATCPHNAWGSKTGPQGQKLKACADIKRLAVVSPDDLEGPVYLLQATASAFKDLAAYQKALTSRGIAPEVVKTRLTFDTKASFPKLEFSLSGFLEEEEIAVVDRIINTPMVKMVTGESDPNLLQTVAVTTPKPQLVKAAPAPAPALAPAPAPEAPAGAALKRGFGGGAKVAAAPAAAAPAKAAAKQKPKVVPAATAAEPATSLEADILNMIEAEGSDDA